MARSVVVHCKRPYDLNTDLYAHEFDQFRNSLCLPPEAFDELGISNHDYVHIRNGTDANKTISAVATKLRSDPELSDGDRYTGALRTNLYNRVTSPDDTDDDGLEIIVSADDSISQHVGRAGRTYDDEVDYRVCHVTAAKMEELGISVGDTVELFNPETGGRIDVTAGDPHGQTDLIRLDVRSRQAINIETGDRVGIRNIEPGESDQATFSRRVQKFFIDSREMPFYVRLGPDQDEYRNIVRITGDMMNFLGIDPGDNVILKWRGKTTKSQCLPTELSEDVPPNTIKIPSTERDQIDISVHDGVTVERDMWYVFHEQMSTSVFGIMGVIVGLLQVVLILDITEVIQKFGLVSVSIAFLIALITTSIFVVWLLLTPERQKCVSHD